MSNKKEIFKKVGNFLVRLIGSPSQLKNITNPFIGVVNIDVMQPVVVHTSSKKFQQKVEKIDCSVVKLPADIRVGLNKAVNKNCLCICNLLRYNPVCIDWVISNFGNDCLEVSNMWVCIKDEKIQVGNNKQEVKRDVIIKHEPVEDDSYNHMLVLYSDDINYLNYVKFEVEKRIHVINNLDATLMQAEDRDTRINTLREAAKQLLADIKSCTGDYDTSIFDKTVFRVGKKIGLEKEDIQSVVDKIHENE